jgi:SpoVK/Ycf46/Vps4 family AAA+-type ATPase
LLFHIYICIRNMPMAQLQKLTNYLKKNSSSFPNLVPALKALSEFVGHENIKETVAKMVLFLVAQCAQEKPLRRSKRKRKSRKKVHSKRQRTFSTTDEEDEDYEPEGDAKLALIALLTQTLQAGADEDSSDEEHEEDPPFVGKCRERLKLLQGHFVHTLLLGKPGSGKTTFATLLVNVWDALGIIDKRRFKITGRSDWVGKYQGHSVAKAKKMIESCKGGVIFIDEAYSIISSKDGDDMYGQEVLTEIVEAMSNVDKQVIFIMAGYENDMKQLFTYNAGLERRFGYVYRFKTPESLMVESIFEKQLRDTHWKIKKCDKLKIQNFFQRNVKNLIHGGGSTHQLLFHSKQSSIVRQFPDKPENVVSIEDLEEGMKTFVSHAQVFKAPVPPPHMYL